MRHLHVICGHGAGDSGAVGNGYTEAERVRALGRRIKELGGDNVTLEDTNRNWYADGGLNSISIPSGHGVVELHMDSGPSSAKGGHVIIKQGYSADEHDEKPASSMKRPFPGRASTIVGRSDLANVNRAAKRGINYRLVENGFISNAGDVATFNGKMDELARAYLDAFGIPVKSPSVDPAPTPAPAKSTDAPDRYATGAEFVRYYNPWGGDHMLSANPAEQATLEKKGWKREDAGIPSMPVVPIYRLKAPTGTHMWTASWDEASTLTKAGWTYEGVGGFGVPAGDPVYRLYNKNDAFHLFTLSETERDALIEAGWTDEGIAWCAPKG